MSVGVDVGNNDGDQDAVGKADGRDVGTELGRGVGNAVGDVGTALGGDVGAGVGSLLSSSSIHTALGHPAALFAKYKYVPRRNNAALNNTPRPTWLRTKPVTSGLPLLQFTVLSMVCSRVDGV